MELTYDKRVELIENPLGKKLLKLMQDKKSNLCLSLDVTKKEAFLSILNLLGPELCLVKTHIDILEDFDLEVISELEALSKKHHFLIFEDRKFADIGSTVQKQYGGGIYKIAHWAHITNAHTLPGPGIIEGLKSVGKMHGRALLLLAEMSSEGNLLDTRYTEKTYQMAKEHPDFVLGFIAQKRVMNDPRFLTLTPGVHLETPSDSLGQRYTSPQEAIGRHKSDVIIVGRGIYGSKDPLKTAELYRKAAWDAYENRLA